MQRGGGDLQMQGQGLAGSCQQPHGQGYEHRLLAVLPWRAGRALLCPQRVGARSCVVAGRDLHHRRACLYSTGLLSQDLMTFSSFFMALATQLRVRCCATFF